MLRPISCKNTIISVWKGVVEMALSNLDNSPANSFTVSIDGIELSRVTEVSGVKIEVDKIEPKQRTKDSGYVVHQSIGRAKPGEFTITRGLTGSKTVTDWLRSVIDGGDAAVRKTAEVALVDYQGATIKTYSFRNCWVKSIELGSLKVGAMEQATETFVLCYDEFSIS
jgi:phage tail-like protein